MRFAQSKVDFISFAPSEVPYRSPFASSWVLRETPPEYGSETSGDERSPSSDVDCGSRRAYDDELISLGEEIMTLSERLHAETHHLLRLIAEFDRREGWRLHGFGSCAEWLAYSTGLDKVTAREKVRVARALVGLPETSAAMARGELSFSQVRAITRAADAENETELLEHARSTSASGLERLVRSWRRLGRENEAALEQRRHQSRCFSVFPDDQGMYVVRGKVDPEVGALLMRAIEAASDALYRGSVPETTPEQRRADALALLAERALTVGLSAPASPDDSSEASADVSTPHDSAESSDASAPNDSAEAPEVDGTKESGKDGSRPESPLPTPRPWGAERYLVILHVDPSTLDANQEPGRSELEDGTRVSKETSRRLACDSSLVRVGQQSDGDGVRVEAKTRAVPLRLRRALEVRDRGCRFPGCGSRFTDAHHIRHWVDGGATRLDNLILLCRTHHRLLHEGGFRLKPDPRGVRKPTFYSPRGVPIPEVPPRITLGGAVPRQPSHAPVGKRTCRWRFT